MTLPPSPPPTAAHWQKSVKTSRMPFNLPPSNASAHFPPEVSFNSGAHLSARATLSTITYWRLGENDPGAASGAFRSADCPQCSARGSAEAFESFRATWSGRVCELGQLALRRGSGRKGRDVGRGPRHPGRACSPKPAAGGFFLDKKLLKRQSQIRKTD
jgi:hypothetical protein